MAQQVLRQQKVQPPQQGLPPWSDAQRDRIQQLLQQPLGWLCLVHSIKWHIISMTFAVFQAQNTSLIDLALVVSYKTTIFIHENVRLC